MEPPPAEFPRRTLPNSSTRVPEVGIALSGWEGEQTPSNQLSGLVRYASTLGIRLYDLSSAPDIARAEWLLSSALSQDPAERIIGSRLEVVHPLSDSGPATNHPQELVMPSAVLVGPPFDRFGARAALRGHLSRLGTGRLDLLLVSGATPADYAEGSLPAALDSLAAEDLVSVWGVYLPRSEESVGLVQAAAAAGARTANIAFNLLEPYDLPRAERESHGSLGWIVRDPHAGGRLDGSLLRPDPLPSRPGATPATLERYAREIQPILRLGFLTEGRKRTLAQAALLYALAQPSVVSVTPRLSSPERLSEWARYRDVAPLSAEEIRRMKAIVGEGSADHSRSK
jgi:aryl-alcohol dehydrogenase-like predicted oxidoreductase